VIDTLNNLIAQAEVLVVAAIGLMAIAFVGVVWARTKSAVPTVGAVVLGAVVVWGVSNIDFVQQKVDQDIRDAGALAPLEPRGAARVVEAPGV
jgi:hypothetical protein